MTQYTFDGTLTAVAPFAFNQALQFLGIFIADRMLARHSLVVADPQRGITGHVLKCAAVTRHLVVAHDLTSGNGG